MKRRETNVEHDLRIGRNLALLVVCVQVVFCLTIIGTYVWEAMEAGILKEFLISIFKASVSISILIFTVVQILASMKRNYQAGIFTTFFDICTIRFYTGMKKISGGYVHKKLRTFLKDIFQKNPLFLGVKNRTDVKVCKNIKPLYEHKEKHLIYRIAFHVPQDFQFTQNWMPKIRSLIIQELRICGIDGLFSSYYDIDEKIQLDSVQLLRVFLDKENAVIILELLYVATKQDANYIIQLRDRELEECNKENFEW